MIYKFNFNYKGINYNEEVNAQHAREIHKADTVLLYEFFPEIMEDKTFYHINNIEFGKGNKTIYLSPSYKYNNDFNK